jgi:hypothetical protein
MAMEKGTPRATSPPVHLWRPTVSRCHYLTTIGNARDSKDAVISNGTPWRTRSASHVERHPTQLPPPSSTILHRHLRRRPTHAALGKATSDWAVAVKAKEAPKRAISTTTKRPSPHQTWSLNRISSDQAHPQGGNTHPGYNSVRKSLLGPCPVQVPRHTRCTRPQDQKQRQGQRREAEVGKACLPT